MPKNHPKCKSRRGGGRGEKGLTSQALCGKHFTAKFSGQHTQPTPFVQDFPDKKTTAMLLSSYHQELLSLEERRQNVLWSQFHLGAIQMSNFQIFL